MARQLFPDAPEPWIDLSTGINPVPYPFASVPVDAFTRLPTAGEVAGLEAIAAQAYGVIAPDRVVAAPGTQMLIGLLPRLRYPGSVAIMSPSYAEHALCWRAAGHVVREAPGGEAGLLEAARQSEVLVVVNPNNPDGRRYSCTAFEAAARLLASRGGLLVVDEAFADFERGVGLSAHLPANAVVLRSFGKTYGLAGVRLGFAISGAGLVEQIRACLGPWAVSGPAIALGRQALADKVWRLEAARARHADAARLDALLAPVLGAPLGGTALFRTFFSPRAQEMFAHLGRAGIFVRRFSYDESLLRLGLPGDDAAWRRLGAAVEAFH